MRKKALSAKIDEELLQRTDRMARKLKTPRNRAIEEGLELWLAKHSREALAEEFRKASWQARESSLAEAQEWDEALLDGLPEGKSE